MGAINVGEMKTGNTCSVGAEKVIADIKDTSIVHALFTDLETADKVVQELKDADLGMSVVISGLFEVGIDHDAHKSSSENEPSSYGDARGHLGVDFRSGLAFGMGAHRPHLCTHPAGSRSFYFIKMNERAPNPFYLS